MVVPDELPEVIGAVESTGLPYAITGSLACIAWGSPRATFDLDILIELRVADINDIVDAFPAPIWYVDRQTILEAMECDDEFSVIEAATGSKIDFRFASDRPSDRMRLLRPEREWIAGADCWLLAPEDAILATLEWNRNTPTERHWSDVIGVLQNQAAGLDESYLNEWAKRLAIEDLLANARLESEDQVGS